MKKMPAEKSKKMDEKKVLNKFAKADEKSDKKLMKKAMKGK